MSAPSEELQDGELQVEEVAAEAPAPLRKNRDFLLLWSGAGFAQLGMRMSTVAFPLLMIWHNHSASGAGLVVAAGLFPMLLLQLPAGVMIDRWDRRRVMIICDSLGVLVMGSVAAAVLTDHVWLPHILAAAFVEGCSFLFYQLAERTAVRNVVEPVHLSKALSQNEARGRASGLFGQPLGSSAFAASRGAPFGLATLGHFLSLVSLLFIKARFQTERLAKPRHLRTELMEGLNWLWSQRFLRVAVCLVACSNFLFQIVNLTPLLIIKNHGGSAAAVGFVGMVAGIGGVGGALSASLIMKRLSLTAMVWTVFVTWTILVPVVAFTTNVWLMFPLFAGMSGVGAMLNVAAGVYMTRIVPDEIQGRAMSAIMLSSWGAESAGALTAGFLLSNFSIRSTLLGVGVALAVLTVAALASPAIRHPEPAPETA